MSDSATTAFSGTSYSSLARMMKRGDLLLAVGIVTIISVMIIPLPSNFLDIGLALSLTFAVMVLMTVLFIDKPLEFSAFPTVLLMATLLRLALNIASTRLILGQGHLGQDAAGEIIQAFGNFVMSGQFIIGIIVFSILVLVNFVVITKGSGRIAEVAARFSLDAMPGKQMAIDADLSSGLISENEAKLRRRELEQESTFFGAMDGAAKFVRGDAIAGLIITLINVIGGIIIGVTAHNMSIGHAADTYVLLTVGDGLVTQIPALIVSISAGLLVSKAGVSGTADVALVEQIGAHPKSMGMTAAFLAGFAILPGTPTVLMLMIAALLGGGAWYLPRMRAQEQAALTAEQQALDRQTAKAAPEAPISSVLAMDNIRLELGYGLLALMGEDQEHKLTDQIKGLRRQLAAEAGFVLPALRIQDNLQLPANSYVIHIKEIKAGTGDIRPNQLLCMDPRGEAISIPGEATREPTFGLPAMWIDPKFREEALFKGYTVVDPATVITTHITEAVRDSMAELLSYAETQKLLDELTGAEQKLVADVIPAQISVGSLQRVLQNLLAERVSIRDLPTILEGVAEACHNTRNIAAITEHVRTRLARMISDSNTNAAGFVPLVTLSPDWEHAFAESIIGEGESKYLSMPPTQLQQFITAVREVFEQQAIKGETPVLLTSPMIRPYVRSIIERFRPQTVVMSQNEIHAKAKIKTLAQI